MNKKNRVKKNKEFQTIFKNGRSMANRQFVIYVLEREDDDELRIGLSVSKKIGNAVTRNRIKRLIRQVFSEEKDRIAKNSDYIIIARKPTAEMSYYEVKSSLNHLFKKMKLYRS